MPGSSPGAAEERALFPPAFKNSFYTIARLVAPPQAGWAPKTDLPATQERIAAYRAAW